jgi:asparagine synthetase B (glutamine-hydrolysing)
MSDLKNQIKDHYSKINLSENQLARLGAINKQRNFHFNTQKLSWGICAMASLLLALTFMYTPKSDMLKKIAKEVIYNHKKNLPPEFLVSQMIELNSRLVKLDFKVLNSKKMTLATVLGGRYCSIQGQVAAQIKVKENGQASTLYQSNFLDVDKEKLPYEIISDGVKVTIWVERNILFAKATNR